MAEPPTKLPFFAYGNIAVGVIAVGNVAIGVVAIGFSVAIGPIAIGLNAVGWLTAIGLNAVGSFALAAINGVGLVVFAGVNGLSALFSHPSVNHSASAAIAPVLATAEMIGFVLVRPKGLPGRVPTVPLADLASGKLDAGEVDAQLVELGGGRGVLEHRGRRVPIEVPDAALAGEDRDGPTMALARGKVPRVRARLVAEHRAVPRDDGGYRAPDDVRVLVAHRVEMAAGAARSLAPIMALTLALAAALAVVAFGLALR